MSRSRLISMIRRFATATQIEKTEELAQGVFLFHLLPSCILTVYKGCPKKRVKLCNAFGRILRQKKVLFNLI